MKKKNEIKKMKAIVNDELANISKEWTEKKLRKEVQDRFRKGIHHTILMIQLRDDILELHKTLSKNESKEIADNTMLDIIHAMNGRA